MGQIRCTITGPWRDTILYEVPIMSISTSRHRVAKETYLTQQSARRTSERSIPTGPWTKKR